MKHDDGAAFLPWVASKLVPPSPSTTGAHFLSGTAAAEFAHDRQQRMRRSLQLLLVFDVVLQRTFRKFLHGMSECGGGKFKLMSCLHFILA